MSTADPNRVVLTGDYALSLLCLGGLGLGGAVVALLARAPRVA